MKCYINLEDDGNETIDVGITDLDGCSIILEELKGFGAVDIQVLDHSITWKQFDLLKEAMEIAEKRWRT